MTFWRRMLEEHRRVLVFLGLALMANLATLLAVVVPLRTAVRGAESDAFVASRGLAEAKRAERQIVDARTSETRAHEELETFYTRVLPPSLHAAETTTNLWLAQAAQAAGLAFKGSHFDWGDVRETALSRASARIMLEGTYADIRRFLYTVETAEEFIVVERVELTDTGDQPGSSGQLQVSLTVSTYFVTAPRS